MHMSSVGKLRLMNREKKMMRYYDDQGPGRGNCTMGIGHYVHRDPCAAAELARKVTEEDVANAFDIDVRAAESVVNRRVDVSLTQDQFDALVSYVFNRGPGGARKALTLISDGEFEKAATEISSHVTGSQLRKEKRVVKTLPGLISRRAEESAPFKSTAQAK